jgi:hypothetical protein
MRTYTTGQNEGSEAVGLVFIALLCFAFGFGIGRLLVLTGLWHQLRVL